MGLKKIKTYNLENKVNGRKEGGKCGGREGDMSMSQSADKVLQIYEKSHCLIMTIEVMS